MTAHTMTAAAIAADTAADLSASRTASGTASKNTTVTPTISRARIWTGRVLSGWAALFFVVDGGMKLFKPPVVVEATLQLGYPESAIVGIGLVLLACTLLYCIPRTAILGAVLLTGYLGGAVATHVRVSGPSFNVLFPVVFGAMVWGGLWLRDPRLQAVLETPRR